MIDWDNLRISGESIATGFSLYEELGTVMPRIAREIGPIVRSKAFLPFPKNEIHTNMIATMITTTEQLYKIGIDSVEFCPRIADKTGANVDTTDGKIMAEILWEASRANPENICLVLGSGDKDYIPALIKARNKYGVDKVAIVASSLNSLARALIPFAWRNPATKKKAIYLLFPHNNHSE